MISLWIWESLMILYQLSNCTDCQFTLKKIPNLNVIFARNYFQLKLKWKRMSTDVTAPIPGNLVHSATKYCPTTGAWSCIPMQSTIAMKKSQGTNRFLKSYFGTEGNWFHYPNDNSIRTIKISKPTMLTSKQSH
jgi:hypothetical protein